MKRLVFVFTIGAAFLFSSGAEAATPAPVLMRASGDTKVFLIEGERKYWIRNGEIFNSYSFSWKSIKEAPKGELDDIPFATLMVKAGDPKVYYIGRKGEEKRWVVSLEVFRENNFDWRSVRTVNEFDFNRYKTGKDITGDLLEERGVVTVEMVSPPDTSVPRGIDFSVLWNTWRSIEDKYRESGTLDTQKMVYGAAEGLVESLGDPYTVFLKPADAKRFSEDISGTFGGIGAELGYKKGIVIIAPLKGMPAEKAGLRAGDRIVAVDSTSTVDMTLDNAVSNIRGKEGTVVTLLIEREGAADLIEFKITRATIKVPTVEWSMKTSGVAYLKIHNFFGSVEEDFLTAIKDIKAAGGNKLILDLRDNPGGLLVASINIAEEFIKKGELIITQDFGYDRGKYEFASQGGNSSDVPVVVLINQGSASASEILAGALKDSKGATLVGEKTFGKGSVQEVLQMAGGATLKVTVASWVRPSGKSIDKEGIEPDVAVEITDADRLAGRDPQFDKALEIISSL